MQMRVWMLVSALMAGACSHQGAVENAQRSVLRNPAEVAAWVALGDAHRKNRDLEAASTAYSQALRLDPENEQLQRRAGASGRSPAVRELEAQVLSDPNNDELWGDLGDAYAAMGDRKTALRHYQYALTLDPDDSEWQGNIVEFSDGGDIDVMIDALATSNDDERLGDLADRLRSEGREDEACATYMRAFTVDPGDNEWTTALGSCGQSPADMIDQVVADAIASNDDERIGDAADLLRDQGDTEGACELYQQAMSIDSDDSEWIQAVSECGGLAPDLVGRIAADALASGDDERIGDAGDMMRTQGDTARACELYQTANQIDPEDSEWIERLRECSGEIPMPPSADSPFVGGRGGNMAPPSGMPDSLVSLGRSALSNGDRAGALQHFEAALLDSPTDRDARVGVMSITGKTLVTLLEELTTQSGDDDELWGDLGDAYLESGRVPDAMRAYSRAAELDPDDFEWQGKLDVLDPTRMGAE
jgi:tetratricopeptide (TPR) repeat protein